MLQELRRRISAISGWDCPWLSCACVCLPGLFAKRLGEIREADDQVSSRGDTGVEWWVLSVHLPLEGVTACPLVHIRQRWAFQTGRG